eukprot:scaffold12045_cov19-Tisochrysis_lutea.AAC.1
MVVMIQEHHLGSQPQKQRVADHMGSVDQETTMQLKVPAGSFVCSMASAQPPMMAIIIQDNFGAGQSCWPVRDRERGRRGRRK